MTNPRAIAAWAGLAVALLLPVVIAAASPLLAWRDPIYIAAGFAGIVGLWLLVLQPLLAGGYLPGLTTARARRVHGWVGAALVIAVVAHVVGLWITSPPDVVDVLLFRSPTPFSVWGAVALWAVFAAAGLAALRRRIGLGPALWRIWHTSLVSVVVVGTVVHALLIEGTMGAISKAALCALAVATLAVTLAHRRPWSGLRRRKA